MKKLITYIYLPLVLVVLFSCEKEVLTPLGPDTFDQVDTIPTTGENTFEGGEYVEVHEYLSTPIQGAELIVPVIVINYIPSNDGKTVTDEFARLDGVKDWGDVVRYGLPVQTVKNFYLHGDIRQKWAMEEGSRYHGQEDPNAKPYLGFKVIEDIVLYNIDFTPQGKVDWFAMFERLGMEDKIKNYGVKEIWFNHVLDNYWVPESNMSSPHKLFKRSDGVAVGDVSNSYRDDNDLPVYDRTYVVYGNSGVYSNNVHNHGHQIEAQLSIWEMYRNNYNIAYLFFQKWGGYPEGEPQPYYRGGRVGLVHSPPNAEVDYDYANETYVESDILDWKPNGGGTKKLINKNAWHYGRTMPVTLPIITDHDKWASWGSGSNKCGSDPHGGWLIYWMQSIPSKNNNIPYTYNDTNYTITNWWDIVYKWDETITNNKNLFE